MTAAGEFFIRFKAKVDDKQLDQATRKSDQLKSSLQGLFAVVGVGVLGKAFASGVQSQIEFARSLSNVSTQLGIQTQEYQTWAALTKRAGADVDELKEVMLDIAERAGDASTGNESFRETFKDLGVEIKDTSGVVKGAGVLFTEVVGALNEMPDAQRRLFRARELSGQFNRLFPLINQSTEALEAQKAELIASGEIMSDDYIASLERVRLQQERVRGVVQGFVNKALEKLLPLVESTVRAVGKWVGAFSKATQGVDWARVAVLTLATLAVPALALALSALLTPMAAMVLGAIAAIAIVDDLAVAFEGGESAIRDFFLAHMDFDILPVLDSIADGWTNIIDAVEIAPLYFDVATAAVGKFFGRFAEGIASSLELLNKFLPGIGELMGIGSTARFARSAADNAGNFDSAVDRLQETRRQQASSQNQDRTARSVTRMRNSAEATAENLALGRTAPGATPKNQTITQNVKIDANGMDPKQAEKVITRVMERERRNLLGDLQ